MKKWLEFIVQTGKSSLKQGFVIFLLLCFFSFKTSALNYYWVGGTGSWSDLSHWATTSGGSTLHNQIPTAVDDVFFDGGSFSLAGQVVSLDAATTLCRDMTWTGVTNTPTLGGSSSNLLKIYGSQTFASGMIVSYQGLVNYEATALGKTIRMSGKSFLNKVTFNGIGGGWTFLDAFTTTNTIYLDNGSLITNNQIVNATAFYSFSNNLRSLNMGSSTFNLGGNSLFWAAASTGFTFNCGTSVINGTSGNFNGQGLTFYDVNLIGGPSSFQDFTDGGNFHDVNVTSMGIIRNSSFTYNFNQLIFFDDGQINQNCTFGNLTFSAGHTYRLASGSIQTVNNKFQIQGSCNNYIILESSTQGSFATITKPSGAVLGFNIHIKDIHTTGGAIFNAYNSVNLGGNTGWLFSTLVPLLPPNVIIGPTTVCAGATGVVYHTAPVAGSIGYQWTVPAGATIVSGQGDTIIVVNFGTATTGNIVVNSFNGCNYSTTGSVLPIILPTQLTPTVSITANPNGSICAGTSVVFTASAANIGSNTINYNFKVNGTSVQSSTSNTLTTTSLINADDVTCTITISGGSCYTSTTATSNTITMVVNTGSGSVPSVTITANPTGAICSGSSVSFTATPTNIAGGTVTYNFKVNGISVQNTTSNINTSSTLVNGNTIKCDISIAGAACITATTASSNTITMLINSVLTPTVTIAANPTGAICSGSSVSFTATPTNIGGGTVTYNFKLNGVSVQNTTSNIYTSSTLANGNTIKCDISIAGAACIAVTTATSNTITMVVNSLVTPTVLIAANPTGAICSGSSVSFTATPTNIGGGTVTYNFKVNGISVQNSTLNTFTSNTLINADIVSCIISVSGGTCLAATTAISNDITMVVNSNSNPLVSLASLNTGPICAGTAVHFVASATNIGGGTVMYNFKVNSISVQNTTSNVFDPTNLVNGDIVTCVVSITGGICLISNTATSNPISVSILPSVTASINIVASATNICSGTAVTFTATTTHEGNAPSFQWKINSINVGTNAATFITNTLNNGDEISCELTSNATCVTNVISLSNNIIMSVNVSPNPSLLVTSSDNNFCPNTPINFTATASNVGSISISIYQWQLNGNNVGTNNSTYFSNNLFNGDVVNCMFTTSRICTSAPVVLNSNVTMVVKPRPIISFNPVAPTILIYNSVVLNATVSVNVATYLWTPSLGLSATSTFNPIANPQQTTTYHLKVTSTDNCVADSSITVKVLTSTYIPNAFTPNGDKVNDVFRIPPTAALRNLQYFIIYNRYGNKIFETTDITKGWDGTYKGTQSGNGAYTYMIKAFDNKGEVFLKGTVLLIR